MILSHAQPEVIDGYVVPLFLFWYQICGTGSSWEKTCWDSGSFWFFFILGERDIEIPPLSSLKVWHILLSCGFIPNNDNIAMQIGLPVVA